MTLPYQNILIECPHALSTAKDIERYSHRIDLCIQQKNIPLLIAELSQDNSSYLPYGDFIWRWKQEQPKKIPKEVNEHYNSPALPIIKGDPLLGLFTSGSSAIPKLIWHRLSHYHHAAKRSAKLLGINEKSSVLSALPCYHNGGFLNLIRKQEYPHLLTLVNHKELLSTWKQRCPHIVIGVPTQLQQALEYLDQDDLAGVTFYCGGAALNAQLWQQALDCGMKIIGTYGLTESCGAILYKNAPGPEEAYQPLSAVEVSLSQDGHLQFMSPSNALALQIGTELTLAQKPWVTCDQASINKNGISIEGRTDQIIICSGENISPIEITNCAHKFLVKNNIATQIYLIGMPDAIKGQIPILLIMGLENWSEENRQQLSSFLRKGLSPLQRPRFMMGTLLPTKGIKITPTELRDAFDDPQTQVWKI